VNFDRLRTFRAVAEALHFRRAAEALHLSQSAVSQQIGALEDELGVLLVERIGRRVYLTAAGQQLAGDSARILASVERAVESVRAYGTGSIGGLRLGASTTPGVYILPAVLGALRASFPEVEVAFRIDNSARIERALVANDLDLGVVGEDIQHEELFQAVIAQDAIVAVVAAPVKRAAKRRRLRSADLARLPLIAREAGSATQRHVDHALARIGVEARPALLLPSPEAQVRAAAAGLGIAFVSRHVAASDLAAGRIFEVAVEGVRIVRPITAAYHRDKRLTPTMQRVIELARTHAHPVRRR
jgi:DNA-binding transcriptional LysR family regulator